ncbi:MAG: hypothetical protein HC933_09135 [Pleurocapsa sp. SU_196_0]|nr:hypothetical protein [Pleurocapsa sp. SU_196_0]
MDWLRAHREGVQALAIAQGQRIRTGASAFERLNGLEPPRAVWSPEGGQS